MPRRSRLVAVLPAMLAIATIRGGAQEPVRHPAAATALARFAATDLEGRRWTHQDFTGRIVLLDFWATWCAPCLADLPRLKAAYERHDRRDFEIVGISLDATARRSFVSWLNRQRIDWPQVHERGGYSAPLPRLFRIDSLPRTILIDADGSIAAVDLRGADLVALIDGLVAERTARIAANDPDRPVRGVPR